MRKPLAKVTESKRAHLERLAKDRAEQAAYDHIAEAPTQADRIRRIHAAANSLDRWVREWAREKWRATLASTDFKPAQDIPTHDPTR